MPKSKAAAPPEVKVKTTVYNEPKEHQGLNQDLVDENIRLGLNPRDRRSEKAGKTLSDLFVTLSQIWRKDERVKQLVRSFWGLNSDGSNDQKHAQKGRRKP